MSTLNALVQSMRHEADGIVSVELRPTLGGSEFPAFDAGSHIDLHLANGLVRSYSLCNASSDRQRYVVAVLKDKKSRGGSRFVHEQLRVGTSLQISAPRNNFKLVESAGVSVLVAGGIGVTPIWAMLQRLIDLGRPVKLVYCARSRREAAFQAEIQAVAHAGKVDVTWHFDDEAGGPPDLNELLGKRDADAHFYCCGPTPMIESFEKCCEALAFPNVHVERFAAIHAEAPVQSESYVVECARSGKEVEVRPGKSILDSLLDAGLNPEYSCKEGVCGACETRVISGEVDHHDGILTKSERAANKVMMICVSACQGNRLVLDV
jgi:ferredoxin-NADP reductase